ncbi:MAG TPA: carboxypeptidase regulatory-like domain-containing protein [Gemmatimonadaceae bacterium]
MLCRRVMRVLVFLTAIAMAAPALAQQTGSITGKVTDSSGGVLPGVTVSATSPVLPAPRETVTGVDGVYQLPALPPGRYTVTFTLSGMQTQTKQVDVQLSEVTAADAVLGVAAVSESVTVTAESSYVDKTSAAISSGISNNEIQTLPVGTQYRDLINLIPGVQYTQDETRGPSAGASGQDNTYNFDGVNVTLPLFGTLSAEPAAYDIAQVTVVKGGAKAVDFKRAGGFLVDSVSKSGTNQYRGSLGFRFQTQGMSSELDNGSAARFDKNRYWTDMNIGGPVIADKMFFYASYYRPQESRENASTAYGEVPDFDSVRNEGFGKVTITPTNSTLVNLTYRRSHRLDKGAEFGEFTAGTAGTGNEAWQRIGTADASWIINATNFLTFKYTHFENPTRGRPDNVSNAVVSTTPGTHLDVNNLDQMGLLSVPKIGDNAAVNGFIQPIIDRYGFVCTPDIIATGGCTTQGALTGGGRVGFGTQFDADDFFRDGAQVAYNLTLSGKGMRHNVHVGYQQYVDSEDLVRSSNGWGLITVPAGDITFEGTPIFYQAEFQSQGIGALPKIHSEYRSKNIEVNDEINWKNWTFNVGLLASNDTLYGQGLVEDSSTISGYKAATGTSSESRKYKMYNVPFSKMIQPRLSTTWAYNGADTIFVSYARYNPAASSLPRAASWDRNLAATQRANFDANGNLFGVESVASSSGKLFVPDLTPRRYDEWLVGTAKQFSDRWSGRAYFRYQKGTHFWEDTNNTARVAFDPPAGIPREPYIPNLDEQRAQIGSGSSYVIAELDGAYTDYREVTLESEYRSPRVWVRGSYTWSRYYGNFDQDNSAGSSDDNDSNIFIGSSNIADGAGRQLWNFKEGRLHSDRPHAFKLYGAYTLDWHATAGAFITAQSGKAWETHSYEPYKALTTSTSDTNRYAEQAGSRREPSHFQIDLNYAQQVPIMGRVRGVLTAYLFNIFDKQTGYDFQENFHSASFGQPLSFYDPRRLEVTFRVEF